MHGAADSLTGGLVTVDERLDQEFEARLVESSTLAFRVAYGVLHHRQDAEDVAQEAFAKAFRKFHQLRDRGAFRAWLVRMTWRMAIDLRRNERRRAAHEPAPAIEEPSHPPTAEADLIAGERSARLWAAIDELPQKLRVATVLAAIEGQSVAEVARLLGAPEGTIKSRLFDARKVLQERLR